jgi:putative DNA primase/helicase
MNEFNTPNGMLKLPIIGGEERPIVPIHYVSDGRCSCGDRRCGSPGKHPVSYWKNRAVAPSGVKSATTDPEKIGAWLALFGERPFNWAISTAGLVVLDADPRNGGHESGLALVEELGAEIMKPAYLVETPQDGKHGYWLLPAGVRIKNDSAGQQLGEGLDVKTDGGYVLIPPSVGVNGKPYKAVGRPEDTFELPAALVVKMLGTKTDGSSGCYGPSLDIASVLDGVPEGQRDNALYSYACSLEARNMPLEEALVLARYAAEQAKPPFDPALAEEKVRRVFEKYREVKPAPELSPNADGLGLSPGLSPSGTAASGGVPRSEPDTDVRNAERLADTVRGRAVYVHEAKCWYTFTGKRWEPDTTGEMYREAKATARAILHEAAEETDRERYNALIKWAKRSEQRAQLEAMVTYAAREPGMTVSATIFDADPTLLACNNGTIDLRTGELRESRPEDFISNMSPYDWRGLYTEAPRWEQFLTEIFPDEVDGECRHGSQVRDYLQVAAGYGATGYSNARAIFICHGDGRNGKGTFLETVRDVLGDYGHAAQSETFMASRRQGGQANSDVADLKGRRLITTSESNRGARIDANLVKSLTGDDKINARHLFQRAMQFKPTWTIFMATNHRPEMPGDDVALWERIKLIPFDVRIEEADEGLKEKLVAEGSGILAWIVRGAMVYLERGLETPEVIEEATREYQSDSDPVGDFIGNFLELYPSEDGSYTKASDLLAAWNIYCDDEQISDVKHKEITDRLKKQYGKCRIYAKTKKLDGLPTRAWCGFELNEDGEALVRRHNDRIVTF